MQERRTYTVVVEPDDFKVREVLKMLKFGETSI